MPRTQSNEREHFWRRHLIQQRASGLTVRALLADVLDILHVPVEV